MLTNLSKFSTLKKFTLTCICLLSLVACNKEEKAVVEEAPKIEKIAVINIEQILQQSSQTQKAIEQISRVQEATQKNLTAIENKLKSYRFKQNSAYILHQATVRMQGEFDETKNTINQLLFTSLQGIIAEENKNYDLIIESSGVLYTNPTIPVTIDITNMVKARYEQSVIAYPEPPTINLNPKLPADEPLAKELRGKY